MTFSGIFWKVFALIYLPYGSSSGFFDKFT